MTNEDTSLLDEAAVEEDTISPTENAGEEVAASGEPSKSGEDPLAKYRDEDGEIDEDRILAELRQKEERLDGMRKKLSNPVGVTVEEMADELKAIEDDGDREFAENFVKLLGKGGVSKEKAAELLNGLSEIYQPEDPKVFFKKEMEKLGDGGKEIIGKVRRFRDAMRDSKEFGAEEIGTLEQVTQTADGVRLIAKVLEKAKLMDAGKFSNMRTGISGGENMSNADIIRLYDAAYALQKTDPEKSRVEVAKLDEYCRKM